MKIVVFCVALVLMVSVAGAASLDQLLMDAIRSGDVARIENMIEQGARVNSDGANLDPALPPLIYAILLNNRDTVATLLSRGADPNLNQLGHYPLYQAVNADTRVLRTMLAAKANPNVHTTLGYTPLHWAASCRPETYVALAKEGHYKGDPPDCDEAVRLLIDAGADVNAPGFGGRTPLSDAITFNNVAAASQLLKAGAKTEGIDPEGGSALLLALDNYASEMYQRRLGRSPTFGSNLPIIQLLLENHANPNVMGDGMYDEYEDARRTPYSAGCTPLTLSARHGWLQIVKLLLQHHADPTLPRSDGQNAVGIAERHKHPHTAALIRSYKQSGPANGSYMDSPQEQGN